MKKKLLAVLTLIFAVALSLAVLSACAVGVKFNLNFVVDGEIYATINTDGEEVISLPNDPTKDEYIFDGWYWDKDIWSRPFTANSLLNEKLTSDMSVYAKWIEEDITKRSYVVTFNSMGGSIVDEITIAYGNLITEPAKPTRTGYVFVGWFKEADLTTKWDFATDTVTEDITLYAKWVTESDATGCDILAAEGFTVDGNILTIKVPNAQEYFALSAAITVSPYATWTVSSDISGNTVIPSATVSLNIGDNTYYINVTSGNGSNKKQYTVNIRRREIYTVTYQLNNGEANIVEQVEEDQTLENKIVNKTGYAFIEWQYNDVAWDFATGISENMTLVATWVANEYDVTFDSNNGSAVGNTTVAFDGEFTFEVPERKGYTFNGWKTDQGLLLTDKEGKGLKVWTIAEDTTLYADWIVNEYAITYNNIAGATNPNPAKYTVEDKTITLSDAQKEGYTFLGWYGDAEYGTKVTQIDTSEAADVELWAKWKTIEYTATFQTEGGVIGTVKFTVEDEKLDEPAVPVKDGYNGAWEDYEIAAKDLTINAVYTAIEYTITYENTKGATNSNTTKYTIESDTITLIAISADGYTFDGWYDGNNKVEQIDKGSFGHKTLTAKWTAIEYTITYESTKGAVNSNETKYTIESDTITLVAISADSYIFDGWYDGSNKVEQIVKGSFGNKTLVAKWTAIEYVIIYENTKGVSNSNETKYTIESDTITLAAISADGYTFDGWYDGSNKVTEIVKGSFGNKTLTAKWTAIEYNLYLEYEEDIGGYAAGVSNPTKFTIESNFTLAGLEIKTVGYTFLGWYTAKNDGEGEKVDAIRPGRIGDLTLYAHWGLEVYTITYHNVAGATNTNATNYTIKSEDITIVELSRLGYNFDGWYSDADFKVQAQTIIKSGSHGNLDFYAKWTATQYDISYTLYGGSYENESNPDKYTIEDDITLISPIREGYVFDGWYTATIGGNKVTKITKGTTGNLSFYARWIYISTISFDTKGGSSVESIKNPAGTAVSAPLTIPTKDHYAFAGWYADEKCQVEYQFTVMPETDITVYAKWTPVEYAITYVLNGGKNADSNPETYTIEDAFTLADATKVGYTFIGWFSDPEFTSAIVTEIALGSHGELTLYANYSINQYTISFESNGGTSVEPITQNYDTAVEAPANPAKNGYSFAGWYTESALNNRYEFTTMPAESITLWAKWEVVDYDIIYHVEGGENSPENPSSYNIDSDTIIFSEPTKRGYTFAGWYSDTNYKTPITAIEKGSYGVVEVYAKWDIITYEITYIAEEDGVVNENITSYTVETELTTLLDAILRGHNFDGWYSDSNYRNRVTEIAGGEIGEITLYGKFTPKEYTVWLDGTDEAIAIVSFNLNGASGTAPAAQTITETNALRYPEVPTRQGYLFGGWYANAECAGEAYDFSDMVGGNITLYAKWVALNGANPVSVGGTTSVKLQGKTEQIFRFIPLVSGNVTITTIGNIDTLGSLYYNGILLKQDDDSGSNGNFLIVYNVTAGEVYEVRVRGFSASASGTATLSLNGSTVVADGGHTQAGNKASATYGEAFTLPVPTTDNNYKFLGWQDVNGVMYTDENGSSLRAWDKDEDTVLFSKWERMEYTVTFVTNGGSEVNATNSVTLEYGARLDLNLYITERSGYTFTGWYLSASDSEPYNASTMPDHNITLYAGWKTFALGEIKYDEDKKAVSVYDEITAELFDAVCLDTDGQPATFTVTVNGKQEAGQTITVRIVATSGNRTKQVTITDIKVYGMPTLTIVKADKDYINMSDELNGALFGASGKDTFGAATEIRVLVDGVYEAGNIVTIVIQSVDPAGNVAEQRIDNVKVYGEPTIEYLEEKTGISVNDEITAALFGAVAYDSFGEQLVVSASLWNGSVRAGNTVTIRLSATDSKGNVRNIDLSVKVYGMPTISNATTTDFRVEDNITVKALGITATDTYGAALEISLAVKEGTQTAGSTMVYTASVTDITGNTTTRDITVKIYGTPSISVGNTSVKANEVITAEVLKVVAKDSFGDTLSVELELLSGTQTGGTYMQYKLSATDKLGNTYSRTVQLSVYDVNDINLTYMNMASDLIKLTSKGEEFFASATDSFGVQCEITILPAEGFELKGGNIISLYIVATDRAGNVKKSEIISNIKVYDMPTAQINQDNNFIQEGADLNFLFTVFDSFGEEIVAEIVAKEALIAGTYVEIVVRAIDDAGNVFVETYRFGVWSVDEPYVEFYVDGIQWKTLLWNEIEILPIPIKEGYTFYAWQDAEHHFTFDLMDVDLGSSGYVELFSYFYLNGYTPISKAEELMEIDLNGKYVLVCDIDLGNHEWMPIGNATAPFTGIFDGDGYLISGFSITNVTSTSSIYVGLFGYNKGEIRNLSIANFTINFNPNRGTVYVGGLVGYGSGGVISNCYATGDITIFDPDSIYAGGLVGYNYAGTISNCCATGQVTISSDYSDFRAGGLVGYNYDGMITNCYATGNITILSVSSPYHGGGSAGGLVGYNGYNYNTGAISNCYATGDIIVSAYTFYAGGLVGYNYHQAISNCYATGNVTATSYCASSSSVSRAGGLIGMNYDGAISNCYATGDVTATFPSGYASTWADVYAGGLVGYSGSGGAISNCYATGDVIATTSSDAHAFAGGLVGYDGGMISNCFRDSGQTVRAKRGGSTVTTNSLGTTTPLSNLQSESFLIGTLGWNADIWNFVEGDYPTLK